MTMRKNTMAPIHIAKATRCKSKLTVCQVVMLKVLNKRSFVSTIGAKPLQISGYSS